VAAQADPRTAPTVDPRRYPLRQQDRLPGAARRGHHDHRLRDRVEAGQQPRPAHVVLVRDGRPQPGPDDDGRLSAQGGSHIADANCQSKASLAWAAGSQSLPNELAKYTSGFVPGT
jgi:hypothetical protein